MTTPSVHELRAALAPYAATAGGWRCPCCSRRLRVVRGRLTGCSDAADLAALVRQAADAGLLNRRTRGDELLRLGERLVAHDRAIRREPPAEPAGPDRDLRAEEMERLSDYTRPLHGGAAA